MYWYCIFKTWLSFNSKQPITPFDTLIMKINHKLTNYKTSKQYSYHNLFVFTLFYITFSTLICKFIIKYEKQYSYDNFFYIIPHSNYFHFHSPVHELSTKRKAWHTRLLSPSPQPPIFIFIFTEYLLRIIIDNFTLMLQQLFLFHIEWMIVQLCSSLEYAVWLHIILCPSIWDKIIMKIIF